MKTTTSKNWISAVAIALMLSFTTSAVAQRFLASNVTAKGRYQDTKTVGSEEDPVELNLIKSTPAINSKVLINLARGNAPSAVVPANLVLAVSTCGESDGVSLVVFDKLATNVVAVVGTLDINDSNILTTAKLVCTGSGEDRTCDVVENAFEGLTTLTFLPSGDADHGILGGSVQLFIKGTFDASGECPVKFSGTGNGSIDVTTTDDEDGPSTVHVLLQRFSITSNKILAQVQPPPL